MYGTWLLAVKAKFTFSVNIFVFYNEIDGLLFNINACIFYTLAFVYAKKIRFEYRHNVTCDNFQDE